MAEEKKYVAGKVEQATTDTKKAAAEKVAKAAKGSNKPKQKKPNIFARMAKTIKRFFKDFKGESKKIVWPDGKTVLKNTLVVIVVVAIVAVVVMLIDQGLAFIIKSLQNLAGGGAETTAQAIESVTEAVTEAATTAAKEAADATKAASAGIIGFIGNAIG